MRGVGGQPLSAVHVPEGEASGGITELKTERSNFSASAVPVNELTYAKLIR